MQERAGVGHDRLEMWSVLENGGVDPNATLGSVTQCCLTSNATEPICTR